MSKKYAIKLEITNSINDDKSIEWVLCDSDEEAKKWINIKKEEKDEWNYHTSGSRSYRYYFFTEYLISDLLDLDVSELQGMKLRDFMLIMKL